MLLALLAKHCGIEAGLFVSFAERHAICAVAVPSPVYVSPEDRAALEESGDPLTFRAHVEAWRHEVGLTDFPAMWAVLEDPTEAAHTFDLFVPIESTVYSEVGGAKPRAPRSWAFLPLTAVWTRIGIREAPLPTDHAEAEVMA